MFEAIGELIFDAIQKQIKESQARGGPQPPFAPGNPQAPLRPGVVLRQAGATAANRAVPQAPSVRPPAPNSTDVAGYASLDPSDFGQAASLAPPAPPASPLLAAFRGGPALLGGIIVAQVLGPPASLKPHSAPGDTL